MKKLQVLKKIGIVVVCLVALFVIINFIPSKKVIDKNPWQKEKDKQTLICAERGGFVTNPENTRKAFDAVIRNSSYSNIIELDLRTTSDNELVIINDETVNRVALAETDADGQKVEEVKVSEKTLAELRKYNLGYNFVNSKGNRPYINYNITVAQSNGLTIMTLTEFLERYNERRDFRIYIDIKEDGEAGKKAVQQTLEILADEKFEWYENRVLIISENTDVLKWAISEYPNQAFGAFSNTAKSFIVAQKTGFGLFTAPKYLSVQFEMKEKVGLFKYNLASEGFIRQIHSKNMSVTYWNVENNDVEKLVKLGADVIVTGDPSAVHNIISKIKTDK